jgi:predicted transposase YbfD/YdcC
MKKKSQSSTMKAPKNRFIEERLVMEYTTLLADVKGHQEPSQKERKSLQMVCQEIGDGRAARGKRSDLAGLLLVLVLAKMAGMDSLLGASEWIKHHEAVLKKELHLCWEHMPCANTYRYALVRLKSQEVNAQLAAWCTRQEKLRRTVEEDQQQRSELTHLAIDGKALRGTGTQTYGGDNPQKHLLHLYEVATGIVLEQVPIETKNNEVSALKPLLTEVVCKGRVLTSDAAQSYHDYGRLVKRAGGDVVVIVKDNTPVTRIDLELFFEDPEADRRTWQSFEVVEKGHGRLERRWIQTSPDLNDFLSRDWGEVGQVFRLQRERTIKGKKSIEVIYGWTTLSPQQCSPQRLLAFIRAHWAVENRLHWRRDATLGEDRCGVRLEAVAEMLAVLNTLVLFLMDVHRIKNVASQLRRFSARPQEACAWVMA